MAYSASPAQIEWHMHLLRQWMTPQTPSGAVDGSQDHTSNPPDYRATSVAPYGPQDFDTYSVQSEPEAYSQLRRAQTTTCFPDYNTYGEFYPDTAISPLSCSGGDLGAYDDVLSCYSDTQSSYLSSEYSDGTNTFDEPPPTSTPSSYSSSTLHTPRPSVAYSQQSKYPQPQHQQQPQPQAQHRETPQQQQPTTEIDALMLAIQPTSSNNSTDSSDSNQQQQQQQQTTPTTVKPRKHPCPHPSCPKSFTQLTHLRIHHRSHTGEKPYTCSFPTCAHSFSQLGNLRTHERRHQGHRPNRKRAASDPSSATTPASSSASSGAAADQPPPPPRYVCRLDACNAKVFTQLGNLKSHQNKFHADTLRALCARLAAANADGGDEGASVGPEERELTAYFRALYKNSNKGIKGRGKGRRVQVVAGSGVGACHAQQQQQQQQRQQNLL